MSNLSNPIGTLLSATNALQLSLSSPEGVLAFVQQEASALNGPVAPLTDMWPIKCGRGASRLLLAGPPKIEKVSHNPLEQGRMFEQGVGEANAWLAHKMADLQEKIQHYLSLNQLAIDGKLSDIPRAVKFAQDSLKFIQHIRSYIDECLAISAAIQANLTALQAMEARMLAMIDDNVLALNNLLNEICNWALPDLPSLAAQIGGGWHWNGFLFNAPAGFHLNSLLTTPNFNFSFGACTKLVSDFESLFGSSPSSLGLDGATATLATPPPPLSGGSYADPSLFSDAGYIAEMQDTTTPVFDPTKVSASNSTSLPPAEAIVSNYALPPETYKTNIVSAVPVLTPAITQPGQQPSPSTLRGLSTRFLTLRQIVASGFDANLTAAWLLYVEMNRAGRGGNWLPALQAAYDTYITPSITYLTETPTPWNAVLGGTGTHAAPAALPLLGLIEGTDAAHILWKLSFLEAALLGYARDTTWDAAADTTFRSSFTGGDLDYASSPVSATPTTTLVLGEGTASYPVSSTFPQSIGGVLVKVIALAAAKIANTPSYQSTRPQFRFTYDMFAQASLVDRFSQFWREFNANLVSFLSQDSYLVSFVVSYPEALDSAIDPLGDSTIYNALELDAATRNRNWAPGSVLLPIPTALVLTGSAVAPTDATNGWSSGSLDAQAFLARPDIQALPLPTQVAMLRTSQSISRLQDAKTSLQDAVQVAINSAQASIQSATLPGWQTETGAGMQVPPGADPKIAFSVIDFDQVGFVTDAETITVATTGQYLLAVTLDWDTTGAAGTRTAALLQNGVSIGSATGTTDSPTPYATEFSVFADLNEGDVLQIAAWHSLPAPQTVLTGGSFLGLLTLASSSAITPTQTVVAPSGGSTTTDTISVNGSSMSPGLDVLGTPYDGIAVNGVSL